MVSGDVLQRFGERLTEPEVRVWMHAGLASTGAASGDDDFLVFGDPDDDLADRLRDAEEKTRGSAAAEDTALIAYDGFEFAPFEFDQYADEYDVPDRFKHDVEEIQRSYPDRPGQFETTDPYLQVLTPGAFFDIHDAENRVVAELLIYHQGDLQELYEAIQNSESSAPSAEVLAEAGLEFNDRIFD